MADPVGRPSKYTQELADKICEELAVGKSLRTVCKGEDMPAISSVFNWFRTQPSFLEQYARAKQESADAMSEEIIDIADDGSNDWMESNKPNNDGYDLNGEAIQRSRLRVDTRKWLMSKMKPKKYGEKLDLTTDGKELPQPIMKLEISNGILRDNSNKENISTDEED